MTFSVVTPVFNRAALLAETLRSILAQRYDDYEVLVVDDGSSDGSADVARSFGAKVRVLEQHNQGPGAARNLALKHATGDYIAFLDSDDVWFPWTLDVYAQVIGHHGSPSFITGCPMDFTEAGQLAEVTETAIRVETFPDYLASGDEWRWYGLSSFVVKREAVLMAGGFSNDSINGEDADLALRLGTAPRFVHLLAPVTFGYRRHTGSIRHQMEKTMRGWRHMLAQEAEGHYPGGPARASERWRIITRHVRPCALQCLDAGMSAEGWQLYRAMFRWHVRLGRWRFLAAFPVLALKAASRSRRKAP